MLQARQSQENESMHKRMKQFREKLNLKFETSFSLEPWLPTAANNRKPNESKALSNRQLQTTRSSALRQSLRTAMRSEVN